MLHLQSFHDLKHGLPIIACHALIHLIDINYWMSWFRHSVRLALIILGIFRLIQELVHIWFITHRISCHSFTWRNTSWFWAMPWTSSWTMSWWICHKVGAIDLNSWLAILSHAWLIHSTIDNRSVGLLLVFWAGADAALSSKWKVGCFFCDCHDLILFRKTHLGIGTSLIQQISQFLALLLRNIL